MTNERFEEEYPYTLDHASYSCASTDCMGRLIREGKTCYTFDGGIINPSASAPQDSRETLCVTGAQLGAYSGLEYRYSSGKGIVLGLGSTPLEAKTVPRYRRLRRLVAFGPRFELLE